MSGEKKMCLPLLLHKMHKNYLNQLRFLMETILAFILHGLHWLFLLLPSEKVQNLFVSPNFSFFIYILVFKQASQTAGFVDPCSHSQSYVSRWIFNLTGSCLHTNISRWYYSLCGSSGISCGNCTAVSPPYIHVSDSWDAGGIAAKGIQMVPLQSDLQFSVFHFCQLGCLPGCVW